MSYRPKVKTDTSGNTQDFGLDADTVDGKHASDLQDKLVSGTNIKTINGNSVLGSGDLSITADDPKARYHLGAFDTVSGNVITRQTGYATSKDFGYNSSLNAYVYISKGYSSNSENVKANISLPYSYNWSGDSSHWYYESNNYVFIVIASDLQDVYIQYKLAISYTEKVIENQPLNTLDQTGSNWLRDEWEKGLNLFRDINIYVAKTVETSISNNVITFSGTNNTSYDDLQLQAWNNLSYVSTLGIFTKGTTSSITFTKTSDFNNITIARNGNANYIYITYDISHLENNKTYTIALTSTYSNYSNPMTISNIMLVEGDHQYPYQEYNGAIVHKKDLPTASSMSSVGRYPGSGGASDTTSYVTPSVLYYWNGANTGTSSNLAYCNKGAFGTVVTYDYNLFVASKENKPADANKLTENGIYTGTPSTWNSNDPCPTYDWGSFLSFRNGNQQTQFYIRDGAEDGVWVRNNWNTSDTSGSAGTWRRLALSTDISSGALTLLWEGSTTGNITGLDTSYTLYFVVTYWGTYVLRKTNNYECRITAHSYTTNGEIDIQCLQMYISSSGSLSWYGYRVDITPSSISVNSGNIQGIYAVYGLK